jgi:nucleoside-diphosphate-sugar epimerase
MKGAVMKVFVAGATGALGQHLVPLLVQRGHEVVGMTSKASKQDFVRQLGARPVVADALDPEQVAQVVAEAEPEVIVHELTALSDFDLKDPEGTFALTNRLRTEGTDHLLAAGRAVGVKRFVAQSFAGWPFARTGGPIKTEEDDLDPTPVDGMRSTLAAIRHVEDTVTGATWTDGVVLRYGGFYGPGTGLSLPDGDMVELIRKRKFPIVGKGTGVWSFVHIEDAASASVEAVERGKPGIYNVVDDDPAPVREWLPEAASAVGARKPMHLPRWIGRLAAGEVAVVWMNEIRGASNAKAKRELGWRLRYPSWRQGFAKGLG